MKLSILRSEFFKNMMTLLSGSALAQLIPFLILPVLQKWFYSPAQFGELALYTSVTMLLAQVAALKYEFAIIKSDTEREAENVFTGAVSISLIVTFIAGIAFLLFPGFTGRLFGVEEIRSYFYLIPLSIFFFSNFETLNYWNNRKKIYRRIAVGKVVKTTAAETSKLGLGYYKSVSNGLIFGRLAGEFVSFLYLASRFVLNDLRKFHLSTPKEVWTSLKKHYRFPLFTMPSVFVGNLINLVFIGMFTSYFGASTAGIIGISVGEGSVAFGLLSQSFSQVFYKELSDVKGKNQLLSLYLGNAKYLVMVSAVALVFVQIIPSAWVSELLGAEWIELMPTLKILVFSYAVSFISSSLSFIYMRVNKQKQMLLYDIMHLLMVSASIYFGYSWFGTFRATLISYTIAQMIYYTFTFVIAIVFIKNMDEE
jgi:O-antigen/teichoic acid export membrane protein